MQAGPYRGDPEEPDGVGAPDAEAPRTAGVRWDGKDYQQRFDELTAAGTNVHGEADFVRAYAPASVLDAGCGTGRVAVELARHGVDVVGVDVDPSMLATARARARDLPWLEVDLVDLDLGRQFDIVVMAGNVPLFTRPGSQSALVAGAARHLRPGGLLIVGFSLGRGYSQVDYDTDAAAAGLTLVERYATWDRAAFVAGADYAVSVHQARPA